jgi:hypothetical protein
MQRIKTRRVCCVTITKKADLHTACLLLLLLLLLLLCNVLMLKNVTFFSRNLLLFLLSFNADFLWPTLVKKSPHVKSFSGHANPPINPRMTNNNKGAERVRSDFATRHSVFFGPFLSLKSLK